MDARSLTAIRAGGDGWTFAEHLLALVVDELRIANWQRSKDGRRGTNRPKRISPWAKKQGTRYGKTDRSPAEVIDVLAPLRPREEAA